MTACDSIWGAVFLVGIAQLVRALDCGSRGRGFESLYPPQICKSADGDSPPSAGKKAASVTILGCRQAVRHQTLTLAFVGSNPAIPAKGRALQMLCLRGFCFWAVGGGIIPPWVLMLLISLSPFFQLFLVCTAYTAWVSHKGKRK